MKRINPESIRVRRGDLIQEQYIGQSLLDFTETNYRVNSVVMNGPRPTARFVSTDGVIKREKHIQGTLFKEQKRENGGNTVVIPAAFFDPVLERAYFWKLIETTS